MILTDREIKISLQNKSIQIEPLPSNDAFSSTAVDLTLDGAIRAFRPNTTGLNQIIDPAEKGYNFSNVISLLTEEKIIGTEGYTLSPQHLILAWTAEKVDLVVRSRVAARVEGKSSLARIGLAVHVTAPTIHAGFRGRIQLEIINLGPVPIRLRSGMKVCQLIFEQTLGVPESGYSGQFLGQHSG